jgi:hypothetical protein
LNQNPRVGGCLILEIFKELPNIGLFINLWIKELVNIGLFMDSCSNNCVLHSSTTKAGQSFLDECNLSRCWYSAREIVTTVITIYFGAKCWHMDYSGPPKGGKAILCWLLRTYHNFVPKLICSSSVSKNGERP